ncbi:MAG: phage tail protein [Gammaproteobacteria bacterium]|nr:phage tail protein [Gammaproteobacteria bacterium]
MPTAPVFAFNRRDPSDILRAAALAHRRNGAVQILALGGSSRDRVYFAQLLADQFAEPFVHLDLALALNDLAQEKSRLERLMSFARSAPSTVLLDGADRVFDTKNSRTNERRQTLGPYLHRALRSKAGVTVIGMPEAVEPEQSKLPAIDVEVSFRAPSVGVSRPVPLPTRADFTELLPAHNFRVEIDSKPIGLCDMSAPSLVGGPYAGGEFDPRAGVEAFAAASQEVKALWPTVTLRRACTTSQVLFDWKDAQYGGKPQLRDVEVAQLDWTGKRVVNIWSFSNCWPRRWTGPTFNANDSGLSFEEIEIYYSSLVWKRP